MFQYTYICPTCGKVNAISSFHIPFIVQQRIAEREQQELGSRKRQETIKTAIMTAIAFTVALISMIVLFFSIEYGLLASAITISYIFSLLHILSKPSRQ